MQPSRQVRFDGHHGTEGSKQAPRFLPCSGTCGASPLAAAASGSNWRLPLAIATSERALTPLLCTTRPCASPSQVDFVLKGYWPEGLLPKNEMRKRMEVGCGGSSLFTMQAYTLSQAFTGCTRAAPAAAGGLWLGHPADRPHPLLLNSGVSLAAHYRR